MDKIIDIYKYKQQLLELEKISNIKLNKEQKKIKEDLKKVLMLPDKFNKYFSSNCWIAYDGFVPDILEKAITIYEENKNIYYVDKYLSSIYNQNFIDSFINELIPFKNLYLDNLPNIGILFIRYFLDRLELIQIAKEDYLNERYASSVPLLLTIIDGITNDIDHEYGFFNSNINLILKDSIVGHKSGLQSIKDIIIQSRKQTNKEPLTIPFRNGILHGRDINFDNKIVASKCWHILFALKDWAKQNTEPLFNVDNTKPITKEDIDEIISSNFKVFIKNLFEKLINGNKNHELIYFNKYPTTIYSKLHRMKELGRLFKYIKFVNFKILSQDNLQNKENLKIVSINFNYKYKNKQYAKTDNIVFEYSNIENKLVSIKNKDGHWKFDFLHLFAYLDVGE
ncbi:MAG: hypothetical protein GQ570_10615 [Helicobacteraceae bacterium]|nr:hypothetical protein [Helicobacteraceae bacterium]